MGSRPGYRIGSLGKIASSKSLDDFRIGEGPRSSLILRGPFAAAPGASRWVAVSFPGM